MVKDLPSLLREKWEHLYDQQLVNTSRIRIEGQEFFIFAVYGNLLFTPEEIEIASKRFKEWPNHTVVYPLWVLVKDDIQESAERLGLSLKAADFGEAVTGMTKRIADTIGDSWDEALDEEVELVVNNRIAKEAV